MDQRFWVAAYITGKNELKFAEKCSEKGVDVYVPKGKKQLKPHRKRKEVTVVESLAFPSYVFIHFTFNGIQINGTELMIVQNAPGFSYLLSEVDGTPLFVREDDMDWIRHLEKRGAFNDQQPELVFAAGDGVVVGVGPLKRKRGVVVSSDGSQAEVKFGAGILKISVSLLRLFRQKTISGRTR